MNTVYDLRQLADYGESASLTYSHVQKGGVVSVVFSPDGQTVASGGEDGTVRLWGRQGEVLATLSGHQGGVRSVVFSPDGQTVASGGEDGTVRLWGRQGEALATLSGHQGGVVSVVFSPDGQTVASASSGHWQGRFLVISDRITVGIWPVENLDQLLARACTWLHDYLTTNPTVTNDQRAACDLPPR